VGDIKIVANIIPIKINNEVIRSVITFQKVSQIQRIEQKIRKKLYFKGHIAENKFEDIIGQSKIINNLKEEAKNAAQVDSPVFLYGDIDTQLLPLLGKIIASYPYQIINFHADNGSEYINSKLAELPGPQTLHWQS